MINFSKLAGNNNFIKILSVIVAFSLWLYVMNEQNPTISRVYTVNLERRDVPSNLVILNSPTSVRVKLSGTRTAFSAVSGTDVAAYVDLQGLEKGTYEKQIYATIPADLQLVEILPGNISIVADSRISRNFPISVKFNNQLPPELTVRTLSLVPNVVTVQGAEVEIDKIAHMEAIFNLDSNMNSKGQYRTNVALLPVDKNGTVVRNISMEPARVFLAVEVIDNIISKEVPVKLAYTGSLPPGYRIASTSVRPEQVTVTGPAEKINQIEEISVHDININYLNNDFIGDFSLALPEGVEANVDKVNVVLAVASQ